MEPGHELVVGATRSGKSFLTLFRIMESFRTGKPLCFIDPRGDGYSHLLSWFAFHPEGRRAYEAFSNRIIFVNPVAKAPYRVGFNAIAPLGNFRNADPDIIALVASSLVSHFRRQYNADWGETNRYEGILTAAIAALVEGGGGMYTLAEIPKLFFPGRGPDGKPVPENRFLRMLLTKVTHPGARIFFEDEWRTMDAHARREWVEPANNRVLKFLFDDRLLTSLCVTGERGTIDFRRVLTEGKWVFVNLPYQYLSEFGTTLMGNLIVNRLFYAALQEWPRRHQYRIILDEGRFFATGPVDAIAETAGACNLWLTLVVQSLGQLSRGEQEGLYKTLLNNSRYLFAFNSQDDEDELADLLFPATGLVEAGRRKSGNPVYDLTSYNPIFMPVEGERNESRRKLAKLLPRQFFFFDRFSRAGVQLVGSPLVSLPATLDAKRIAHFEASHLARTGRPAREIEEEIRYRRLLIDRIIAGDFEPRPQQAENYRRAAQRRRPEPDFGEER